MNEPPETMSMAPAAASFACLMSSRLSSEMQSRVISNAVFMVSTVRPSVIKSMTIIHSNGCISKYIPPTRDKILRNKCT